jgi:hypothetical protein
MLCDGTATSKNAVSPQVDVDLIDAHLDPFDQGSEDRTCTRRRPRGQLPPDLRSSCDKPLLR